MTPLEAEMKRAALLGARVKGCTCDPDVELELDRSGVFWHCHVRHDDWCPLLARIRANRQEAP